MAYTPTDHACGPYSQVTKNVNSQDELNKRTDITADQIRQQFKRAPETIDIADLTNMAAQEKTRPIVYYDRMPETGPYVRIVEPREFSADYLEVLDARSRAREYAEQSNWAKLWKEHDLVTPSPFNAPETKLADANKTEHDTQVD